jgi:preprotein translocase subunit YajC
LAKSKKLVWGLLALLITIPLLFSGCFPTQSTASPTPGEQTPQGFDWTFVIFIVIIIAAFYFFMIRPQSNRRKQQQRLLSELRPGDQVITNAGIYGEVDSVDTDSVVLKVEGGSKIRVATQAIAGKRNP